MIDKRPETTEKEFIPLSKMGGIPPRRPPEVPVAAPESAPAAGQPQFISVPSAFPPQAGVVFSCPKCQASLTTQGTEHSGHCPICGHLIAELPKLLLPSSPQSLLAGTAEHAALPTNASTAHAPLAPEVSPPVPPVGQDETLSSRRPGSQRIRRSGNFNFRPLGTQDIPDRLPDFERDEATLDSAVARNEPGTPPRHFAAWRLGVAAVILLLGIFTAVAILRSKHSSNRKPPATAATLPVKEIRATLNEGALKSLQAILASEDPAEIASHVIGGEQMIPVIKDRLDAGLAFPRLSKDGITSQLPMKDDDSRRGLCGLLYEAAPDDPLSLDNPLLRADMAAGVTAPGLLERAAVVESMTKPAPRKAMALFVKRNGRMLLDWDLFVQTWDRSLRAFSDGDLGSGPMRFRVVISKDKPVFENGEFVDQTIIRVQDPLHSQDIIRIAAFAQDPAVSAVTPKPAKLDADPTLAMRPQTATVDLVRSESTGRIEIERLVCIEFLGLGGSE